jgi:heptose-I-phosphate ethanolaminephosphotransferase
VITISLILIISIYKNPSRIEPFNMINIYIDVVSNNKTNKNRTKNLLKLNRKNMKDTGYYDKIIVVQGESVNKNHMSIYNYEKATTPFLSSLKPNTELYIFNAISPTNQTRYSVPMLHTKANVSNFTQSFTHSKSLTGEFSSRDYKTYWLSNQGETGIHDSAIATIAKEANIYRLSDGKARNAKPDAILLKYLNEIKDYSGKEMYVFHLVGSHFEYENRYDKTHLLFKNPTTIVEKYDNTIFYTDFVIKSLFNYFTKKFINKKILFIYISDHGEVVNKKKYGHGFSPAYKDEYEVPFIIYTSIENSRIKELHKNNEKGYFNLENLNYMLLYISGISNDKNISYSSKINVLTPKKIADFNKLEYYNE